jgi:hypothetical protein
MKNPFAFGENHKQQMNKTKIFLALWIREYIISARIFAVTSFVLAAVLAPR